MFTLDFFIEHEKIIKQIFVVVLLCALVIVFWKKVLLFVCVVGASVFAAEFIAKDIGVLIFVAYCFYLLFRFYRQFNDD